MQLGFMGKIKCCFETNTQYFEILDKADIERVELLKPRPIIRHGEVLIRRNVYPEHVRQQYAYAMMAELHMMRHMTLFGQIVKVDPDGTGMELSMQRFLITPESEWTE